MIETQATGRLIEDLVGGGRSLYLTNRGAQSSIRKFDLQTRMETVVKAGPAGGGVHAGQRQRGQPAVV